MEGFTTVTLAVQGMTCGHCTATVESALRGVAGVTAATVDLASNSAVATISPEVHSVDDLVAAIDAVGFDAQLTVAPHNPKGNNVVLLDVQGMTCGHCTSTVESALSGVAGVAEVSVNLAENAATVTLAEAPHDSAAMVTSLIAAVEGVGFDASLLQPAAPLPPAAASAAAPRVVSKPHLSKPPLEPGAPPAGSAKVHVATMFCGSCERWVTDAVSKVTGVATVVVNLRCVKS